MLVCGPKAPPLRNGMQKITAYILSYNEAEKIEAAVSSVLWADEVLVVDSFSTDRTAEIAAALGARVVNVEFKGFGDLRNRALEHCSHDWIFSLDSDERCTPDVRDEILGLIAGVPAHDAARQLHDSRETARPSGDELIAELVTELVPLRGSDEVTSAGIGRLAGRRVVAVALAGPRAAMPGPGGFALLARAAELAGTVDAALVVEEADEVAALTVRFDPRSTRVIVAGKVRPGKASTVKLAFCPTFTSPTSASSIATSSFILVRSSAMTNRVGVLNDAATVWPGST